MKKSIFLFVLAIMSMTSWSQNAIQNFSFEDTGCELCDTYYEFYEGCVADWQNYRYVPAAFDSSDPSCTFYNGAYYYAPHGDQHAMIAVNSGIFQEGNFQAGNYSISFQYTRGEAIFEDYPVYINVGFANDLQNVDWDDDSNLAVPIENMVSLLVLEDHNINWATYSGTFELPADFDQIVIYGSSMMKSAASGASTSSATRAPTMRALIDNFSLIRLDPCIPEDIKVTVDGEDVTDTLSYTIPCGQTCINVAATNVENAVYNTDDLVLTDLEGLFCVTDPDMTSFTAYITGQDTCGEDVNIAIDVTIEQDCPPDGCDCVNGGELQAFNIFGCDVDFALGGFGIDGCATLIPEFTWDFGDTIGTDVTTTLPVGNSYTYGSNGTYTVTVSFDVEYNDTGELCTQTYEVEVVITDCEEECDDEPYIEPYWELCDSNNVCELESWPVRVLDDDGTPLLLIDGYTFVWDDSSTSDVRYGVTDGQTVSVTVTYPDGCEYFIEYVENCCEGGITVEFDECPSDEVVAALERQLEQNKRLLPATEYQDMFNALQLYKSDSRAATSDGHTADDCDPCDIGTVVVFVIDVLTGEPITNWETITVTNNDTGLTIPVYENFFQVYVDVSYTVTVTVQDPEGHICTYSYEFIYDCEDVPCSELPAPTNLQVSGTTLSWDPVPGAVEYIVSSPVAGPIIFCDCPAQVSIIPFTVDTNSVTLTGGLASACFVWQVTAVCADGSESPASGQMCYPNEGGGHGKSAALTNAMVTPNPTKGDMTFTIDANYDTNVQIEIYNFNGILIKSFNERVLKEGVATITWNATGVLPKGIYFIQFKTAHETIQKKLIVN
ncbi:MAG: T9SS type A sorting domain-containing protein [Gilvibacter sp.]